MDFNLADKIVVLTGAGGGLGSVVAAAFAACGCRVAILDTNEALGQKVAEGIAGRGGTALALTASVRSRNDVGAVLDRIESDWGVPDILVNAAGVLNRANFLDETDEDWDRVMGVNLKGTWLCSQLVARRMIAASQPGAIVNFSSINSEICDPNQTSYVASKGGVRSLTKAMAVALAPHGIRVNEIAPGTILSDINRGYLEANPEVYAMRIRQTPLGRLGLPEDVVGGVLYLASDLASYVTGTTLTMDGGRLPKNTV